MADGSSPISAQPGGLGFWRVAVAMVFRRLEPLIPRLSGSSPGVSIIQWGGGGGAGRLISDEWWPLWSRAHFLFLSVLLVSFRQMFADDL